MTNNDLFYVCSLIEYIARKTKNKRGAVVRALGINGIVKQLHDAPVNHCLSFEQVCEEVVERYEIANGEFDTISGMRYSVPGVQDIGKLYAILVECMDDNKHPAQRVYDIFDSFLSDEISRFSTDLYYQNPDYLLCSYQAGKLL